MTAQLLFEDRNGGCQGYVCWKSVPVFHRYFVEDGLVLAVIGRCALVDRLGVGGGRIQTGKDQLLL